MKKNRVSKTQSKRKKKPTRKSPSKKGNIHPWRVCPYGEHQVVTHPKHNPPSKTHPEGSISTVHWHCAKNPSGKDQLYPDEIQEITNQHFSDLKNKPCSLPLKFVNGSEYDALITGWVQYWNELLEPDVPVDPNLVKALIASESGFTSNKLTNKKNSNSARGLMQITNDTRKLLGGSKGDLKDHLITATKADLNDPSVNICAGIRWLFEKRRLASSTLKEPASWLDAI